MTISIHRIMRDQPPVRVDIHTVTGFNRGSLDFQ